MQGYSKRAGRGASPRRGSSHACRSPRRRSVIVAMLSQTHGEYWLAGGVSATFALTNALVAPQISRLVDRLGQTARTRRRRPSSRSLAFAMLILAAPIGHWPTGHVPVRLRPAGRGDAEHPGDGARTLDRDFPRNGRSSPRPSRSNRLPTNWSISPALRCRSGLERRPVSGGRDARQHAFSSRFGSTALILAALEPSQGFVRCSARRISRDRRSACGPCRSSRVALIFIGAIFATAEVSAVAITKELGRAGRRQPGDRCPCRSARSRSGSSSAR